MLYEPVFYLDISIDISVLSLNETGACGLDSGLATRKLLGVIFSFFILTYNRSAAVTSRHLTLSAKSELFFLSLRH